MRETSCCLCQTIIKLILLKLLSTSRYLDGLFGVDGPYFVLRYRMAGITESAMIAYTHEYAVV